MPLSSHTAVLLEVAIVARELIDLTTGVNDIEPATSPEGITHVEINGTHPAYA